MAKDKKVEQITNLEDDFAQWYTDICRKAELVEYASVKGFTILRPYGFAIWENMQRLMDAEFKKTGHENVAMPVLIPESLLKKEGELVNGFAPEVAWVTMGGSEKLEERLAFRPTSETMFCDHWSRVLQTYRQLPMLYNQWCSVIRWEKTTRPFLRSREFWWQEGHTIHETAEEAQAETMQQLNCYADFFRHVLAIPVVPGRKTEKEKFAGAEATYTVECMMKDRKALQGATSHYFGDKFSRAYEVTFTGRDNKLQYPFQTSWGSTTRMIGAVIMTHGDNNGLVLPPRIAPIQVVVVPVAQHKPGVIEKATELYERLKAAGVRVKIDVSDNSLGWKCAQYEMKGVPLRIELGPRDIENNVCMAVRRDNGEKISVSLDEIDGRIHELLDTVQQGLFDKAKKNLDEHIFEAHSLEEAKRIQEEKGGFIKTMWCGELECELKMKEQAGMSSRCIPFDQEDLGDTCPICGKKAKHMIYWGVAY
ncbi:MAG: proline--tRNA ligase [Oscillibacter sp.]|nr:proline--tRNA ligase [Oscillibacter sp.]